MAIHSVVLEKPLGDQPEGTVIQVEESVAEALCSAGVAREATEEDVVGGDDEGAETDEAEDTPEAVQDQVQRIGRHVEEVTVKAAEKVAEKLVAQSAKRPRVVSNVHVAGSDEGETGGFRSMGEWTKAAMSAHNGDFSSMQRMNRSKAAVLRTMQTKGQMTVGTPADGGYLVPQQWAKTLWKLSFDKVPDLLGMCSQYPMETNLLNIPAWVQASGTTGITSAVTAEAAAITDTKGVVANVQLSLVKFAALVNTTDELERFNTYALESVLKQVVPQRIRYLVNDSIVNGTNSQVNLINNAATVVVTRATNNRISFQDILKMEAALFDDFVDDAIWLINNSTSPEVYGLAFPNTTATTQFPAFTPGAFGRETLLGPRPVGELLGKPVYRVENCPALGAKGDIILYSPKSIAAGSSGLIADKTPYLYFDKMINTYRFAWYADTVNPLTSVYTRKDGSTASNIVVLSASS